MKSGLLTIGFSLLASLLVIGPGAARAQGGFEVVTGQAFDRAIPADFYLEGNRIPVEKRNSALLKNGSGGRVVLGLIDTTGYSSQIQQKYTGMLITETKISVCGNNLGVGSYGFGLQRPAGASDDSAPFQIYNQAGTKVGECTAKKDTAASQAKPLSVVAGSPAKVYFGKYVIEIK